MYNDLAETFAKSPEVSAPRLDFYQTIDRVGLRMDYHLEIPTVAAAWSLSIVQLLENDLQQKIGNCKLPECEHFILDVPRRSRQSRQYCGDQHANTYRARKKRGTL